MAVWLWLWNLGNNFWSCFSQPSTPLFFSMVNRIAKIGMMKILIDAIIFNCFILLISACSCFWYTLVVCLMIQAAGEAAGSGRSDFRKQLWRGGGVPGWNRGNRVPALFQFRPLSVRQLKPAKLIEGMCYCVVISWRGSDAVCCFFFVPRFLIPFSPRFKALFVALAMTPALNAMDLGGSLN